MSDWQKFDKLNSQTDFFESLLIVLRQAIEEEEKTISARIKMLEQMGIVREDRDDTDIQPKP